MLTSELLTSLTSGLLLSEDDDGDDDDEEDDDEDDDVDSDENSLRDLKKHGMFFVYKIFNRGGRVISKFCHQLFKIFFITQFSYRVLALAIEITL